MSYKESEIRDRLGFGKSEMKAFRDTAPEGSWYKEKSNKPEKLWSVMWTDVGVDWIISGLNKRVDVNAKDVIEEVTKKPDEFECKVLVCNFPNKRLVKVEKDGIAVMAVCKDNTKLKPRMIVKVKYRGNNLFVTAITKKHMHFKT